VARSTDQVIFGHIGREVDHEDARIASAVLAWIDDDVEHAA
jgi:hypothetical protein